MMINKSIMRYLSFAVITCLLLSACGLSIQPKDSSIDEIAVNYPHSPLRPGMVDVQFIISAAAKFSDSDIIALDVVDQVAGFQHNLERYRIEPPVNGTYRATITLPEGATIAYRYSMVEPMQVNEVSAEGTQVPFRLVVVRKNLIIQDLIAGWQENPYTGSLASLNGAVADLKTEEPISDALVNVAGKTTITDMNGRFYLRGIPVGVHNMVVTTIDGSYQSFQQEVNLVESLSTLAIARMIPNPEITLTFVMTPPKEVYGAPVRIAGNSSQFGQTISDFASGNGVQAVNMPEMTVNSEDQFVYLVKAYAGNVLRYSYTLGDSRIGLEHNEKGLRTIRQFIIPDQDAIINDSVITWRSSAGSPSTFYSQVPDVTPEEDLIYMQFNQGDWSNPIPMWQAQDGRWVFVFFPSIAQPAEIIYRYCRFSDCEIGKEDLNANDLRSITIGSQNEIHDQILSWQMFDTSSQLFDSLPMISFPYNGLRGVEVDDNFASAYLSAYQDMIPELTQAGFNWLILRPVWSVSVFENLPHIDPHPSQTMPSQLLEQIAKQAHEAGFQVAIFPELDFGSLETTWWQDSIKNSLWWQQWYAEYERMVTHLIKLSTNIRAEQLILGGPGVKEAYPNWLQTVGENFGTPRSSEEIWTELLEKIDQYYDGDILLAHSLTEMDTEYYSFYDQADGLYLLIDAEESQLGYHNSASVGQYLDSVVSSFKRDENFEIYIGLNAPSYQTANTQIKSTTSEIISATNPVFQGYNVNIDTQTNFYVSYLESIVIRSWIDGLASRGFFPGIKLTDFSSSIYGKPAYQLFHNQ